MGLKIGERIPEIRLKDQYGRWFDSNEVLGKQPLVIFFYPMDFTPGCIAEVCSFREHYAEFKGSGAILIGISGDKGSRHLQFSKSYGLPFRLLSDTDGAVRRRFKVRRRFLKLLPGRETFVTDPQGRITGIVRGSGASLHAGKALAMLKAY